ncbi:MAG TPA: DUF3108 domain-containing protein [Prevotella sp.]|nr:DUF3108 domain-containing protein [Prevotella sp.]
MKQVRAFIMALLLSLAFLPAEAQCAYRNTAFKSGEFLSYNLYFNWKFVWVKAGTASFSTVQSNYKGQAAWRGSLITRSNQRVDKMFVMRDTLLCYNSIDLEPLYYRKGAREGARYTVDEVFYSYPAGKCHVKQHRQHSNGSHSWEQHTYGDCVYDMMSIFLRARSFNPTGWKKGHDVNFPIADGNSRYPAKLRYEGKVNVKADNGATYRCLKLAYMENEKGEGFKKIVDFFVTDDQNHIPVRLDMHLRFGSAKAFLTGMKGIKSPITSKVK